MNRARVVAVIVALAALGIMVASQRQRVPVSDVVDQQPAAIQPAVEVSHAAVADVMATEPTFVGRDVCKECHADNHRLHAQHGHASTFASANDPEIISKYVGKTFDAGEPYGTYTYGADEQGLFALMPDKFGDEPFRLEYALGHHSITLLSLIPDPDKGTVGIEHRASWIAPKEQLGPTPGQEDRPPGTLAELFGNRHEDRVMHKCVYCHVTTGKIVDQEIVNLTPNVNCEKCHGPASHHVHQARMSLSPPPFSVGRDDWDAESELQLCGDCHRLPHAISRKELREYSDSLTRFQPIGLVRSECYLSSNGQLKCTTCHNPHTTIEAVSEAEHVQNCIDCHLENSDAHVACPVSPAEGCIECHMPAIAFEALGISFHDHWIRVVEDE